MQPVIPSTHHQLLPKGVESELLDFFMPLVQEHQFVGILLLLRLIFCGEVPQTYHTIFAADCQPRFLARLELDRSDCLFMVTKLYNLSSQAPILHHPPQVPDLKHPLIVTRCHNIVAHRIPIDDVDIGG
jgi:hypothetical protein